MSYQIKVELQDSMGNDRSIAEAAWTSSLDYQKKQTRTDADVERVVKMLAQERHSTPFESVILRFWIKMPIMIDRQHMTHRIASHNGMSGRYRTMPSEYLDLPEDVDDILKKVDLYWLNPTNTKLDAYSEYYRICEEANNSYNAIVNGLKLQEKHGIISNSEYKRCREIFRGILPQCNMTERISIFNLRSFANYQKLRNTGHAQLEICNIADMMLKSVREKNIAPIAIEALISNGWNI
jgi:thymidylate synthase (FAD)